MPYERTIAINPKLPGGADAPREFEVDIKKAGGATVYATLILDPAGIARRTDGTVPTDLGVILDRIQEQGVLVNTNPEPPPNGFKYEPLSSMNMSRLIAELANVGNFDLEITNNEKGGTETISTGKQTYYSLPTYHADTFAELPTPPTFNSLAVWKWSGGDVLIWSAYDKTNWVWKKCFLAYEDGGFPP